MLLWEQNDRNDAYTITQMFRLHICIRIFGRMVSFGYVLAAKMLSAVKHFPVRQYL